MLESGGVALPIGDVVLDLVRWLVVPLLAGQLLCPLLGDWAARNKSGSTSSTGSTPPARLHLLLRLGETGVWSARVGAGAPHDRRALVLFFLVMSAAMLICDALRFSPPDRIAAVFCGSKKTLASGVPMAQLSSPPARIGLILLRSDLPSPPAHHLRGAREPWAREPNEGSGSRL